MLERPSYILTKQKTLFVDLNKCTGCRICEKICSLIKNCDIENSRIQVLSIEELNVNLPVVRINCDCCEECVNFCPTKAITFMELSNAIIWMKKNKLGYLPCPIIKKGSR